MYYYSLLLFLLLCLFIFRPKPGPGGAPRACPRGADRAPRPDRGPQRRGPPGGGGPGGAGDSWAGDYTIPCTLYSMLYNYSILYTLYSILYTLYSILYTILLLDNIRGLLGGAAAAAAPAAPAPRRALAPREARGGATSSDTACRIIKERMTHIKNVLKTQ